MAIIFGGITYDADRVLDISIEGLLGFVVLAEQFTAGKGGFVIAQSSTGLHEGAFARIVFDASGDSDVSPHFFFAKESITLGSGNNDLITFQLKGEFPN